MGGGVILEIDHEIGHKGIDGHVEGHKCQQSDVKIRILLNNRRAETVDKIGPIIGFFVRFEVFFRQ